MKKLIIIYISVFLITSTSSFSQYIKLLDFSDVATGASPFGSLLSDGNYLYGLTLAGGINEQGVIFKIKPDGTGFLKLMDFAGTATGSQPHGSLISDGTFLYGMTHEGGINGDGTIFKIKQDGTGFVKLFDFAVATSGGSPDGSLVSDGTFLYGMTATGGVNGYGTLFKIMPDGSNFLKLLDFDNGNNGVYPHGSLLFDGAFLYGMTYVGGAYNFGTVFKIKTDGTGYLKLTDFPGASFPYGSLISDGTFLYGMTLYDGLNNTGTVFKIKTDGTGFMQLLDLTGAATGNNPYGSLIYDGTFLYGMTYGGGINGEGAIFKIKPDGTGFLKLVDFTNAISGGYPKGSLISDGTFLYGMTSTGGANGPNGFGVLFKLGGIVGIDELNSASQISIHPNPSNGQFSFNNLENESTIEIVDLAGRLISQTVSKNNSCSIDLSEKDKGIYFYKVINEKKEIKQGKIVLQ